MENNPNNSKTLATNSLALFFRMLLRLGISIYSTRVILNVLGVQDYGIYNLVAGFTLLFAFFNTTMSGAVSRFLSYDIGIRDFLKLRADFKAAFTIQLIIAVIILFIAETFGLWFLNACLSIPEDRLFAANVVYQCTILGMIATMFQVPFNAAIIAHEKMTAYAYIEIINALLLLVIIFVLRVLVGDKLIIYGFLFLCVVLSITLTYYIFCKRKFEECGIGFSNNKLVLKKLLSFSGWDLYANIGLSAHQQGVNAILNIFFGAVLNAAVGVANQLYSAILMFSSSITVAIRPQIIKSFAQEDFIHSEKLVMVASRFISLLSIVICVPLISYADEILSLWLINPPKYAVLFARIILINHCCSATKAILIILIHASGDIKKFSLLNGTLYFSAIPIMYLFAKFGLPPYLIYGYILVLSFFNLAMELSCLRKLAEWFDGGYFIRNIYIPVVCTLIGLVVMGILFSKHIEFYGLFGDVICAVVLGCISFIIGYFSILNKDSREMLKSYIYSVAKKIKL